MGRRERLWVSPDPHTLIQRQVQLLIRCTLKVAYHASTLRRVTAQNQLGARHRRALQGRGDLAMSLYMTVSAELTNEPGGRIAAHRTRTRQVTRNYGGVKVQSTKQQKPS